MSIDSLASVRRGSRPKANARDYFSAEEIGRAHRFRRGQRAIMLASTAVDVAALATLVRRPPSGPPAAVAAGMGAGMTVLGLPLAAAARQRAVRVGLITQGWRGWATDLLKAEAISAPLSAAGGALVVAGMRRFGERWWLPGAGGLVAVGVLSLLAGPTLLDPVFNTFEPAEPGLRERVQRLAAAAGVRVDRVLVMDASRRTTASNAYVTGLGPTKRVVLYDTLLRDFEPAQVDFVVAHELAHVRHRDVPRALGLLAAAAPALMWSVARLSRGRADASALPRVTLAAGAVAPLFGILANTVSRRAERRADRFAMALVEDPKAQIAFQRDICVRNVAEPEPPRWVRVVFGSHPTTLERIAMAEAAASAS
jgi:Zn-dependent protease with chaperone function